MKKRLYGVLTILLLLPAMAQAEGGEKKWNNVDNMASAYQRFLSVQQTRGNDTVRAQTAQCYQKARMIHDIAARVKELEYCIAYDVANIEFTTAFYSNLAKRYNKATNLQPEDTTRPVGKKRVLTELTAAKVSEPQKNADMMYQTSALIFFEFLKFGMKMDEKYSDALNVSGSKWKGVDSEGRDYEYHFNTDGSLYYKSPTGFWKNGTWKQDKSVVYMEMNNRYSEYRGLVSARRIEGGAWNVRGHHWSWVAERMGN